MIDIIDHIESLLPRALAAERHTVYRQIVRIKKSIKESKSLTEPDQKTQKKLWGLEKQLQASIQKKVWRQKTGRSQPIPRRCRLQPTRTKSLIPLLKIRWLSFPGRPVRAKRPRYQNSAWRPDAASTARSAVRNPAALQPWRWPDVLLKNLERNPADR